MNSFHTGLILLAAMAVHLNARQLSIPDYEANPGGAVEVPVYLDNAFGISSIEFQVNYDTAILTLQSVNAGSLGLLFEELVHEVDDGVVTFFFASSEEFLVGSGNLVVMRFETRDGAESGLFGEVAIASYRYSDNSGVLALHRKEALAAKSGKVTTSSDPMIDNAGNGLPDWWERDHGLDPFIINAANHDSDGDGLVNILEFGLVGDPHIHDAATVAPRQSMREEGGMSFITLSFKRRTGSQAPSYTLIESDTLDNWWPLVMSSRILSSLDHGDGTETITVQGSINVKDPASKKAFLSLEIE